jgi:hypothetical protein
MNITNDNFKTILTTLSNLFPNGTTLWSRGRPGYRYGLGMAGNGGIFLDNQNPISSGTQTQRNCRADGS